MDVDQPASSSLKSERPPSPTVPTAPEEPPAVPRSSEVEDPAQQPSPDDPPKISHERGKSPPADLEKVLKAEDVPTRVSSPKPPAAGPVATPEPARRTPSSRRATPMIVDEPPRALPKSSLSKSRRASPVEEQNPSQPHDRPLNVTDALTYLDEVKVQFADQPDVYNQFLDIMKEFKNEQIDTPGVIERVSQLFHGHPALIQGFNTFLPSGYRIECSTDAHDSNLITVTTPSGTIHSTQNGSNRGQMLWTTGANPTSGVAVARPESVVEYDPGSYLAGHAIEPAVQYVQKIKASCDHDTYRQFLGILSQYHHATEAIDEAEVSRQISLLFKDAPDLANDFRVFMPDRSQQGLDGSLPHQLLPRTMTPTLEGTASLKRKRKNIDKDREREKEALALRSNAGSVPPSKKSKHANQDTTPVSYNPRHIVAGPSSSMQGLPPQAQPSHVAMPSDDSSFFDHVKRALDSRDVYHEFLKLINLFTQEYVDRATLVKESRNFLGDTELHKQLRDILGWDERKEKTRFLADQHSSAELQKPGVVSMQERPRPGRIDYFEKYGSYRKVPAAEANIPCSGRDEMCRSVLNDEWVCHPTWTSEDSGFIAHKKNIYEEALHRSEEERHEYDFHIEAITRTISNLEPINNKIAQMNAEDRGTFKLKPNLGGTWKAIHQRVIKKIYGREPGLEVIQSMQDTPALAIPIVLTRLKQKEDEWKRAQREWNKVWREVDARNYAKSLDHQAITFKAADKKAITIKALVSQIEAAREEQMAARASLIDPLFSRTRPRHQLDFVMDDVPVLQDAMKLTFSFLDRTQAQINFAERRRIEGLLRSFIPLFFTLDPVSFNAAFSVSENGESEGSDADGASNLDEAELISIASSSKVAPGRGAQHHHRKNAALSLATAGGDLRKKLLKSEQAKSTSRKTRAHDASPAGSRPASPALIDEEMRAATSAGDLADSIREARRNPRRYIFFTNTAFYVLIRLLQLLVARLSVFKDLSAQIALESPKSRRSNPGSSTTGLSAQTTSKEHCYEFLLETCERLFDNEVEQHAFEDQMRAVFGIQHAYKIFTVDKLIGAIIKQVQAIFGDAKSQDLLENLKRERSLVAPTTQEQINTRRNAEKVLGPDENIFRIDWLSDTKTITVQLIGKDDSRFDDSEVLTGRWQSYIESYVSSDATSGVSQSKMKMPFLKRNIPAAVKETQPDVSSQDSLEIKICVRTYRLFYVTKSEDFLWKYRPKDEMEKSFAKLKRRSALRQEWLQKQQQSTPPPSS
ncbi:hypothetical protein H1R20_g10317, partial [Candolleomyces eurysporus]